MSVNIYLPLCAHLVQYMKKEAARTNGELRISQKSLFGMTLINLLEKMPVGESPGPPKDHHLILPISQRMADEHGCYIKPSSADMIKRWIKRAYEEEMLRFIRNQRTMYGTRTETALLSWRERYDITDDVRSYDADLKEWQRKR